MTRSNRENILKRLPKFKSSLQISSCLKQRPVNNHKRRFNPQNKSVCSNLMLKSKVTKTTSDNTITMKLNLSWRKCPQKEKSKPLRWIKGRMTNMLSQTKILTDQMINWSIKSDITSKTKSQMENPDVKTFPISKICMPKLFKRSLNSIKSLLQTITIKDGFGCNFLGFV